MGASAVEQDVATAVLGPPVAGRGCGECTACCTLLDVDEPDLRKPQDVTCPHCTGSGCARYPDWPRLCGQWFCAWRRIPSMPEMLRPDRLRVMFFLSVKPEAENPFMRRCLLGVPLDGPEDLDDPNVHAAIGVFSRQVGLPVGINVGGMTTLIHPPAPIARAIVEPGRAGDAETGRQAAAWRRAMGLGGAVSA